VGVATNFVIVAHCKTENITVTDLYEYGYEDDAYDAYDAYDYDDDAYDYDYDNGNNDDDGGGGVTILPNRAIWTAMLVAGHVDALNGTLLPESMYT
jgi:hypothetical protein